MNTALLCLSLLSPAASHLDEGAAVELRYSGTLEPTGRDAPAAPVKRFTLYCLVTPRPAGGRDLAYLIDERGGSGWSWPERFGSIRFDRTHSPGGELRIKILHEHDDTLHPLELQQPLFEFTNQIEAGAQWNSGRYRYEVAGTARVGDFNCREVTASTNFGRSHRIFVEQDGPLVVRAEQRVVIGQGEIFNLTTQLDSVRALDENRLAILKLPLDGILDLITKLDRKTDETQRELSDAQIQAVTEAIDRFEQDAEETPFASLVSAMRRDLRLQAERSEGVAGLVKRYTGQKAAELKLTGINGEAVDSGDHDGRIVLLHFWKYNGEPLEQPYGQVGYLDYLNSRRRKLGVKIYGVAIDPRLTSEDNYAEAIRDVRKLSRFMNLSYTVTADDGSLLREFGDPRRVGAELPLWVLIDPEGKIAHYKVGFYEVKADEGLKELDERIVELIRAQRDTGNKE